MSCRRPGHSTPPATRMAPRRTSGRKASKPQAQAAMASSAATSGDVAERRTVAPTVPTTASASQGRRGAQRRSRRTDHSSAPSTASASRPSGSSDPSATRAAIQRQVGHRAAVCKPIHNSAGARSMRMAVSSRRGERVSREVFMMLSAFSACSASASSYEYWSYRVFGTCSLAPLGEGWGEGRRRWIRWRGRPPPQPSPSGGGSNTPSPLPSPARGKGSLSITR